MRGMRMWRMGMMGMMAMHRMMKMNITPVVVSCAAWPGEAEASESTRLTLKIAGSPSRAEHDCMRLSNGVAWRARSGWGVEGGVVPNERPCNPRGPDSDGDAQALPPGIIGWLGHFCVSRRRARITFARSETTFLAQNRDRKTKRNMERSSGPIYFPQYRQKSVSWVEFR